MGENDGSTQSKRLTEELIKEIDQRVDSPNIRATYVWKQIKGHNPDLTDWDVLCFCVDFLGMICPRYPWLTAAVKQLSRLVYSAHYFYPENINARVGELSDQHSRQHTSTESRSNDS